MIPHTKSKNCCLFVESIQPGEEAGEEATEEEEEEIGGGRGGNTTALQTYPVTVETIQVRPSQHGSAPFAGGQVSPRPEHEGGGNAKGVGDAFGNGGLLGDGEGVKGITGDCITTVLLTHRCSPEPSYFVTNFKIA
jgi:hypothetical protein